MRRGPERVPRMGATPGPAARSGKRLVQVTWRRGLLAPCPPVPASARRVQRCLTPRSSRAPTA